MSTRVTEEANKELIEVARRSDPSVLRQRAYKGLSSDNWMADVLEELARCPVVFKILSGLLESSISTEKKKKNPATCLIYGIMFLRWHELSRIQRINSVLLTQGQASVNVSDTSIYQNLFHY